MTRTRIELLQYMRYAIETAHGFDEEDREEMRVFLNDLVGEAAHRITAATAQAADVDPFRVEIKENSKGEPQISVRATAPTMTQAVEHAITLYRNTEKRLGETRPAEGIER